MAPSLNYYIFPKQPAKVTVSVCIPHKGNLVKLSLAYFTAVVRAPEEYAVRRNGLRLFYLISWSRSWCCLIRGWWEIWMVTQRCLGQTEGDLWDGVCWVAKVLQSWDQVCQMTAALWHWNVGSFVFFRFTLVPCFGLLGVFLPYPSFWRAV